MRVSVTDCPVDPFAVEPVPAEGHAANACAENLAADVEEVALELHECIVWSSGISFSHQLPDAFISTATAC